MDPATMMAAASVAQKVTAGSNGSPAAAQMPSVSLSSSASARSGDITSDFKTGSMTVGGAASNWVYIALIAGAVVIAAIFIFKGKR